ncbi:MAG: helix-turn-helix transcriptional regulator [Dermatophilaceae bacterium]
MHNTRLGPRHAPLPVPGLGPARRRVLAALLRRADGATITELTQELGGHPNSIRLHLDALASTDTGAGPLVEAAAEPPVGRGRPATRYRATETARTVPAADPAAEDYRGLVSAFAEHLAGDQADPRGAARGIGRGWGRRLAGARVGTADEVTGEVTQPTAARREVIGLLGRLGFSPEADDRAPGTHRLTACPLLDVARAHPEVVCQVHLGLVQGALETHQPGNPEDVDLAPFAEEGACLLRIGSDPAG